MFYVKHVHVTSISHFLIFLFYCNLAELLIFLSCNIGYVFLSNAQLRHLLLLLLLLWGKVTNLKQTHSQIGCKSFNTLHIFTANGKRRM